MKKTAAALMAAFLAVPTLAHGQDLFSPSFTPMPGFYIGAGGGASWLLGTTSSPNGQPIGTTGTGWAVGGKAGWDFVGPRAEVEVSYGQAYPNVSIPNTAINGKAGQLTAMANLLYDFLPASLITPYVGAGIGVGFVDSNTSLGSTVFAFQGMIGLAYNYSPQLRLGIEGRYLGTTSPQVNIPTIGTVSYSNNNILALAGITYKFTAPAEAPPPAPPPVASNSFMVFFDWDRSNLSQQALTTIQQAANAFRAKGNARITATGHTDTSGPSDYNMALSLRRANAVKDALVRDGVPATAITVIGKGETGLLVPTPDGVREPQNRRVEIVLM